MNRWKACRILGIREDTPAPRVLELHRGLCEDNPPRKWAVGSAERALAERYIARLNTALEVFLTGCETEYDEIEAQDDELFDAWEEDDGEEPEAPGELPNVELSMTDEVRRRNSRRVLLWGAVLAPFISAVWFVFRKTEKIPDPKQRRRWGVKQLSRSLFLISRLQADAPPVGDAAAKPIARDAERSIAGDWSLGPPDVLRVLPESPNRCRVILLSIGGNIYGDGQLSQRGDTWQGTMGLPHEDDPTNAIHAVPMTLRWVAADRLEVQIQRLEWNGRRIEVRPTTQSATISRRS